MKTLLLLVLIVCAPLIKVVAQTPKGAYVFAYFKEPGTQGIYLALSRDGYIFTPQRWPALDQARAAG